jgi:hypothetical protein
MSSMCRFLFCTLALLAVSGPLRAQGGISLDGCNRLLGGNYDSLPTSARQARLVQFDNCWRRLAVNAINGNYREIVDRVNAYKVAARQAVFGEIAGKADTARRLLHTDQRAELAALDQRYQEESRAIQLQMTPENRDEQRRKGQELLLRTRQESATIRAKHQRDNATLEDQIRDAYTTVDNEVDKIVYADLVSIGDQQTEKLEYVGDMFDRFLSGEVDSGDGDEPDFGWLEGLFRYYSGLVGEKGEPEKTHPFHYGSIGIRG